MPTQSPREAPGGNFTMTFSSCVSIAYAWLVSAWKIGVPALGDAEGVPSLGELLALDDGESETDEDGEFEADDEGDAEALESVSFSNCTLSAPWWSSAAGL